MEEKIMLNMIVYTLMAALNKLFPVKSQKGVTMIEYALIAALIAVAVIAVLVTVGSSLNNIFSYIGSKLTT
ncbi:Flp family type IVb pilin [Chlorobaculum sp. MV4-Y]|uniref:Flp family type IVb pilin n=1 Tax=Chlorobaculum sp. MV4-Y TaxID=2976335 RepID=UPI0021AE9E79|nr:Flp family type IVb pilin [Chlorobaculum sp. MV4-Y]UWX58010.1 Flp family type IVb pilin [Chlorobaculum sp. MV4-Y]UWX58012.1 Flp family type IVb pilin [Chlorobaculum sp. MV4-Y]UWX58014.1 Flp family type IVb pilin [Chlorobaculum sp. MV4-Y]